MSSKTLTERMEEDHVPYDIWVKKGYVTLTNGSQNDFSLVTKYFINLIRTFDIPLCGLVIILGTRSIG